MVRPSVDIEYTAFEFDSSTMHTFRKIIFTNIKSVSRSVENGNILINITKTKWDIHSAYDPVIYVSHFIDKIRINVKRKYT